MNGVLLEARPFRPFKSSEEYLYAMKEDLAEWLQTMYPHLNIHVENFMEKLETGVALCEHANAVRHQANEYVEKKQAKKIMTRSVTGSLAQAHALIRIADVKYFSTAKPGTFFARDNVSNFIRWCRISLEIIECLLFESDDLIMRKNEKHVILCLLEVARRGAKFGMLAPMLVQMERQIDREIAADQKKLGVNGCGGGGGGGGDGMNEGMEHQNFDVDEDSDSDIDDEEPVLMYGPVPQIVTNDLKSLDEMVRDLVEKCTCPTQFPMIRVSEGKYRIGDTKVLIFVRILRNHVMVRVGGGWDTLAHYLDKHDPCRCRSQHRTTQGARLVNKPGAADLHGSHVYYERSPVTACGAGGCGPPNASQQHLGPPMNSLNRSRSRSPSASSTPYLPLYHNNNEPSSRRSVSPSLPRKSSSMLAPPPTMSSNRSRSPTPNFTSTHLTKLSNTTGANSVPKQHRSNNLQQIVPAVTQIPLELNGGGGKVLKSEASLQIFDTDHSDTTSEMSDEGYRSLGVVQDKSKQRSSLYSQNSVEDADDNEPCIDDLNDCGLRKTQYSQQIYDGSNNPTTNNDSQVTIKSISNNNNNNNTKSSKPTNNSMMVSRASSVDRILPSGTVPSGGALLPPSPASASPAHHRKSSATLSNNKLNTWNGRQKHQRASLNSDTFINPAGGGGGAGFNRNATSRRSVSAAGCGGAPGQYDRRRRASSTNTSPTKGKLRQELLNAVRHTEDDELIALQVQELLRKYGSMNVLNNDEDCCVDGVGGTDDDFPATGFMSRRTERMSFRSPRKDSKPENNLSRIPAPVVSAVILPHKV